VIEDLVVDETRQMVAVRWSAHAAPGYLHGRGSHRTRYPLPGIEIIRVEDGRIAERWANGMGSTWLSNCGCGVTPDPFFAASKF